MEKSNQQKLKNYLVGEKGYLKSDISNGKVIMLSGKWGSGKTFFWKNDIATDEFKQKITSKESAYSYVSLYGKSSIEEIENDIFAQLYFSAIGGENIVTQKVSTFTKYTKRYGSIFSEKIEKFANGVKEEQKDNQERIALERLKNGAIICFDDFERKSKDIDLNDLFGFITQLTLNFSCKVVIILNDDVFEGEEKKIFSNVKEKSVSKFLKYEPSIEELFHSIYEEHEIFEFYPRWEETILKYIEESKILNARIYTQVLDNILEFFNNTNDEYKGKNEVLRCLILVNINFILYHTILIKTKKNNHTLCKIKKLLDEGYDYLKNITLSMGIVEEINSFDEYIIKLKNRITVNKENSDEKIRIKIQFIEDNLILFRSDYFANKLDISKNVDDETFQKINNFIETGILIDE